MNEELQKSIDDKLTVISRLLSLSIVRGRPINEQMELLHNAGMTVAEIATTLGKTPNHVRVELCLMTKKSKKKVKGNSSQTTRISKEPKEKGQRK